MIPRRAIAEAYNRFMGGVDLLDMQSALYVQLQTCLLEELQSPSLPEKGQKLFSQLPQCKTEAVNQKKVN